jgi:hypothetical protein
VERILLGVRRIILVSVINSKEVISPSELRTRSTNNKHATEARVEEIQTRLAAEATAGEDGNRVEGS